MKILVTGASGFIGNYVIKELLKQGHSIIATSRNIEKVSCKDWFSLVQFIEFDIDIANDEFNYFEFFDSPDALIHLAWGNLPDFKSEVHLENNLKKHFLFLKSMIKNGLRDITIAGTCLEYGLNEGELNELQTVNPITNYGIAKNSLRLQLEKLQENRNFSMKWLRLFYIYGEGQYKSSLYSQINNTILQKDEIFNMSFGEQERDYLSINEIAVYIVNASTQTKVTGIINCCSGKPIKIKNFVANCFSLQGYPIKLNLGFYPYTDYEPMCFWGNNKKINSINIKL